MKTVYAVAAMVVAVSLSLPGAAFAGKKSTSEVRIFNDYARGALGSVRNSRDSLQYISCSINANGSTSGVCTAMDANGKFVFCTYVNRPDLDRAVASMSDDAFILFGWDNSGQCSQIRATHHSAYEPRVR